MKRLFIFLLLNQIYLMSGIENPDISVSGDIYFKYNPEKQQAKFGLGGIELGINSSIDTFAEAKVTVHFHGLSISEAGHVHLDGSSHDHSSDNLQVGDVIELEEAWVKLNTIPGGFQLAVGRLLSSSGLVNGIHLHDYHFVEYPRVVRSAFGDHAFRVDGLKLSWLAPLPFWFEIGLEGQFLGQVSDFATGNLNVFFEINENHGLSLEGFGIINGWNQSHRTLLFNGWGAGFRYKYKPVSQAGRNHFILAGEFINRNISVEGGIVQGLYLFAEWLLAKQFSIGVNYDGILSEGPITGHALTAAFSWHISEFQRLRLQYTWPVMGVIDKNKLLLNWNFLLGPHRAHQH